MRRQIQSKTLQKSMNEYRNPRLREALSKDISVGGQLGKD